MKILVLGSSGQIEMEKLYQHGSSPPHMQTVWIVTEIK
jgi:hypothetical protein